MVNIILINKPKSIIFCRRFVSNETLFSELTKIASSLPGMKSFLGGNAPVMARRLANMGANVLLAASLGKELINSMPDNVKGKI